LDLGLLAFAGLCLEMLLAFLIEPLIYGKSLNDLTTSESIIHWIITGIMWLIVSYALIVVARKKHDFDVFSYKSAIGIKRWAFSLGLLTISIVISVMDWNGFKVVREFQYQGWLKFIFQYFYYICEAALFVLMIVFAQHAGEIWFGKSNIPWGGIFISLTWGLVHILTKGDLLVGILACLGGLLYGCVYIVCKKNLYIAYPIILLMFIL